MNRLSQLVYLVGAYKVGTQLYDFGRTVYNTDYDATPLKKRLNDKYGKEGEWALITGASEGIGKQYALQLAQAGYNLRICARSVDKLEVVAQEAQKINPAIQTEVVKLDVSSASAADYGALFREDARTSIVVNNAGIMRNNKLLDTAPAKLELMIKTNVHPYVYMTKYALLHFMKNMDQHDHKNALLYTGSMAAYTWMAFSALYSGTKAHTVTWGNTMSALCNAYPKTQGLVDFQTLNPAGVSTNLNHHRKVGADCVSAESCAKGSLSDLGSNTLSIFGAIPHSVMGRLIVPLFRWNPEINKQAGFKRSKDPAFIDKS